MSSDDPFRNNPPYAPPAPAVWHEYQTCPHCFYTSRVTASPFCNCHGAVAAQVRKAVELLEMLGYKVDPPPARKD